MRHLLSFSFALTLVGACSQSFVLECGPGTVNQGGICLPLEGGTPADATPDIAVSDGATEDRSADAPAPDVRAPPEDAVIGDGADASASDAAALDSSVAQDVPLDQAPTDVAPADVGLTDTGTDARSEMDVRMGDTGTPSDTGGTCSGRHPLVMGTRRYCESGDCYCGDPDTCFPAAVAASCCRAGVVCGGADAGPVDSAVACVSRHPLVMGTRRYCESGDCYCGDPDACFSAGLATACCRGAVTCTSADAGLADAAVTCTRQHPLVMGTRRYCAPGQCFCASPDACLPAGSPGSCCAGPVTCF